MSMEFTTHEKEKLEMLTKMSNIISNNVWMAENGKKGAKDAIETSVWIAEHFLKEIEAINQPDSSKVAQTQTAS